MTYLRNLKCWTYCFILCPCFHYTSWLSLFMRRIFQACSPHRLSAFSLQMYTTFSITRFSETDKNFFGNINKTRPVLFIPIFSTFLVVVKSVWHNLSSMSKTITFVISRKRMIRTMYKAKSGIHFPKFGRKCPILYLNSFSGKAQEGCMRPHRLLTARRSRWWLSAV